MIIEEKDVSGTLYRYHPDPDSPNYTAGWIVTDEGEIKGFISTGLTLQFVKDFGAWARNYEGRLVLKTAVHSIEKIMGRFGFVRMGKPFNKTI